MQNKIKITIAETEFTAMPIFIEGIVARANAIHNGRIYPASIMEREVKKLAALVALPKEFLNNGSERQVGPGAVSKTDGPRKGMGFDSPTIRDNGTAVSAILGHSGGILIGIRIAIEALK